MAKQVVVMDYGHSKVDPINGKCSPDKSFFEWEFNRKLGRKITNRLRGMGITVFETVSESDDTVKVNLTTRANRCNDICAKYGTANVLFVSIHSNAAGNGSWMNARGWSVFVSKNCSEASKKLAGCIFDAVEKEGFKMRKPLPTQKYWQENFTVLTKTKCKAVLTENLFYDNKEDLALLKDDTTIQKLLDAHVNGILKYLGVPSSEGDMGIEVPAPDPDDPKCECACECCKNH